MTATLFNGKKVKEGDRVAFTNSDGVRCEGTIQRREHNVKLQRPHYGAPRPCVHTKTVLRKGSLYFWNDGFPIQDYITLDLI